MKLQTRLSPTYPAYSRQSSCGSPQVGGGGELLDKQYTEIKRNSIDHNATQQRKRTALNSNELTRNNRCVKEWQLPQCCEVHTWSTTTLVTLYWDNTPVPARCNDPFLKKPSTLFWSVVCVAKCLLHATSWEVNDDSRSPQWKLCLPLNQYGYTTILWWYYTPIEISNWKVWLTSFMFNISWAFIIASVRKTDTTAISDNMGT